MNQIARQLKEKNIAEYLIYMWQEEDLIRANHGELEEIEANVIARYPEDQRPALREWYQEQDERNARSRRFDNVQEVGRPAAKDTRR